MFLDLSLENILPKLLTVALLKLYHRQILCKIILVVISSPSIGKTHPQCTEQYPDTIHVVLYILHVHSIQNKKK